MIGWLLKWIGVSEGFTSRLDKVELFWARPTVLWVGLALLVPTVVFIVLRHRNNLPHVSPGMRRLLSSCRAGVLLLLIVVLAGPGLRLNEETKQKPILAIVIDESASMNLPAGPFSDEEATKMALAAGLLAPAEKGKPEPPLTPELRKKLNAMTRTQLLDAVLAHQKEKLAKPLAERFDVQVYRAARQVRSGTFFDAATTPLPGGEAQDTDLGGAIGKALDNAAGKLLGGVVVFSDGRWTTGPDPVAVVQRVSAAENAGKSGDGGAGGAGAAPVWRVPVGGATPMPDVAVVDVLAPSQVSKGDTIAIMATVDSHGLDNKAVQIKLLDADGKPVETKPLTLNGAERQQVQLTYTAGDPGATLLTVAVDEQPEDLAKENNKQRVNINVATQKQRVLYLEGYPRWDFRFLDHAIRRDNGLDATLVIEAQLAGFGILPGDLPQAAKLPQDAAGFAEYNTVILGDISPTLLPVRLQEQLAKAVEEDGVGLIVQAGPLHMPQEFAGGPLAKLLPVKISAVNDPTMPGSSAAMSGLMAPDFTPFRMKVTATGAIHPVFQLYDNATQNRTVWSRMPEFFWAAAVEDAGPTATVLSKLETTGESRPLVAERYAGRGRVLFVGTDSTYRWRRNIGSHLFYRLWGQAIRHVARSKERSGDKSWVEVTPGRVEPGETVAVELYAVDSDGKPLDKGEVKLRVTGADSADQATLGRIAQAGHFRGLWQPKAIGAYRLSYTDARGRVVTAAVDVAGSGRELRRPTVDRDLLGTIADTTGGGLLELNEIARLPEVIKGQPVTLRQMQEAEVWDNWITLVLLVGLYCTDVGVRRLLGLT